MPALQAKIFRDYFGGSWFGKITKNGEFQRKIIFNWPELNGNFSALGTEAGFVVPPGCGVLDNTRQVAIAGWRSDIRRWCYCWHNEFGGSGELQWTSQEKKNGITILYGFVHECKQESDDPIEHIVMCEMYNIDNFKYTVQSFRKGVLEINAERIRTAGELKELLEYQTKTGISFSNLH